MSGKFEKKKSRSSHHRKKKGGAVKVILIVAAILLAVLAGLLIWIQSVEELPEQTNPVPESTAAAVETEPDERAEKSTAPAETAPVEHQGASLPIALDNGLQITDFGAYTGAYMEDGTDAVVSNVLMIIVENTSEEALQYGKIQLHYGDSAADFLVTTLPAGQKVVLLEQSRMACPNAMPDSAETHDLVFVPQLELYEDIFEISAAKGSITVKNISENAITGEIYVYYKNSAQDLLYGGITYRVKVEGLEPGESKQAVAAHYNPNGSTILMVTYIPE